METDRPRLTPVLVLHSGLAEISVPHSCAMISLTLRVETPMTYISATASFGAFSERQPFQRLGVERQPSHLKDLQSELSHAGGDLLVLVALAWPRRWSAQALLEDFVRLERVERARAPWSTDSDALTSVA